MKQKQSEIASDRLIRILLLHTLIPGGPISPGNPGIPLIKANRSTHVNYFDLSRSEHITYHWTRISMITFITSETWMTRKTDTSLARTLCNSLNIDEANHFTFGPGAPGGPIMMRWVELNSNLGTKPGSPLKPRSP